MPVRTSRTLLWGPPRRVSATGSLSDARGAARFLDRFRGSLAAYIEQGPLSLQAAAEITGLSQRTPQRRLAEHGSSFSLEYERERREHALRRVGETEAPLLDIAMELDYSDQAHFTRAFRRWAGLAPSVYRKACGRELTLGHRA